jgi:hypothetical protein
MSLLGMFSTSNRHWLHRYYINVSTLTETFNIVDGLRWLKKISSYIGPVKLDMIDVVTPSRAHSKIHYPPPTKGVSSRCLKYRVTANLVKWYKLITLSWTWVPKHGTWGWTRIPERCRQRTTPSTLSQPIPDPSSSTEKSIIRSHPIPHPPPLIRQSPQAHHTIPPALNVHVPMYLLSASIQLKKISSAQTQRTTRVQICHSTPYCTSLQIRFLDLVLQIEFSHQIYGIRIPAPRLFKATTVLADVGDSDPSVDVN